ncbi:MAG: hypothetical protein HY000_08095 [Planctomycetes bacterium]|nr:hypothetical protein [Planctomycetota bacterium]
MQDLTQGYSAKIDLQLLVNGQALDVAQVGPSRCVLTQPVDLPPGTEGEFILTVDGHDRRWHVLLLDGAAADNPVVRLRDVPSK